MRSEKACQSCVVWTPRWTQGVSLGSGAGARERQNLKAIIQTYVSRNDSPVLELNHVDSDSPRFAGDVDHMRRPAFPSSGWAPVPDGDNRHFWGIVAESQLQHPAVAALPLVCARALKPVRKSRRVAELQPVDLRRNQREEARAPVVQILEGLCRVNVHRHRQAHRALHAHFTAQFMTNNVRPRSG